MNRQDMIDMLSTLEDRYPIWIISYSRAGTAPLLNAALSWRKQGDVNVVVRQSQADDYRSAYPRMTIRPLPDDEIDCVGKARWAAAELAYTLGNDIILMMDDDILSLRFLFQREFMRGQNVGKECSGHSGLVDLESLPDLPERVLAGISAVAREAFEADPTLIMGGAIKQHMSFDYRNHRTKYIINGGVTPRQVMVWNLARMDLYGVALNTERFGIHGDDIGIVAEVLKAGGSCFAMPSFAYEHWPESINIKTSVVRNADNKQALHEFEWESLQMYPIKDYLRAKRSVIDGSYEWGDVNWKALSKIRGVPSIRAGWDPDQPPDGPSENLI